VVVEDRLGLARPALFGLLEVLEDGDELQALAAAGGGELGEVGQRGEVGGLVEHEQQRRVDRLAGAGGALVDAGDDVVEQADEQRREALLVFGGAVPSETATARGSTLRTPHARLVR
jgi:hypothetical protein